MYEVVRIIDDKTIELTNPIDNDSTEDLLKIPRHKQKIYYFDYMFDQRTTQERLFNASVKLLIDSIVDGYNTTCFCYGATGSGKSYTYSPPHPSITGSLKNPGVLVLSLRRIFNLIQFKAAEKNYQVKFSYLEIYNELIHDLLSKDPSAVLELREDPVKGVSVAGLSEVLIDSPEAALRLLAGRNRHRIMDSISASQYSSASHTVFQVVVEHSDKCAGIEAEVKVGKFSLIDLAGSERTPLSSKLSQGTNITRSLLALGNCINRLSTQMAKGMNTHIPYRESKLTRLLKDSLGGNCQTLMIGNIAPSNFSYEDTYNTLKYATRAKNIKTNVQKNVVNVQFHVSQYDQIIAQLRKEVLVLKEQIAESPPERLVVKEEKDDGSLANHPEAIEPLLTEIKKQFRDEAILRKKLYLENKRVELMKLEGQLDGKLNIELTNQKILHNKLEELKANQTLLHSKIKDFPDLHTKILRGQMTCESNLVSKIPIEPLLDSQGISNTISFHNRVIQKLKEQIQLRDSILKNPKGTPEDRTSSKAEDSLSDAGPLKLRMGKDVLHREGKAAKANQKLSRNQSQFSQAEDLVPYAAKEVKNEKRSGSVVYKLEEQSVEKRQKMLKKNYLLSANKELIKIYRGGSKFNKLRNPLNNKSVRLQDAGSQIIGGHAKIKSERPNCSIQLNNVQPLNLMKLNK